MDIGELIKKGADELFTMAFAVCADLFFLGRHRKVEQSAYKDFLDEALWQATTADLRQFLEVSRGMSHQEAQYALDRIDGFFARHPRYSKDVRYALACVSDPEQRVIWLDQFARARSEQELNNMCEHLTDKHAVADFLLRKFVEGPKRWQETVKNALTGAEQRSLGEFLHSLNPVQRFQFKTSIGGVWDANERVELIRGVLAQPNHDAMRRTALDLLIIKEDSAAQQAWCAGIRVWAFVDALYNGDFFDRWDTPADRADALADEVKARAFEARMRNYLLSPPIIRWFR